MAYQKPLNGVVRQLNPSITILSVPFTRLHILEIGGRSTFITLPSKSLAIIAPVPYDESSASIVGDFPVKWLIAPDFEHHMALKSWKEKYPDAKVIGVTGLRARKASQGVAVDYEVSLPSKVITPLEAGIDDPELNEVFKFVYAPQHPNKELVTYHEPTKTLIEADLLFNLPALEQYSKSQVSNKGGFTRIFNSMHPGSWLHAKMVGGMKGKPGGIEAIKAVDSLDFETLIPCHGEVIESDAKEKFKKTFAAFF
ncbi:hypothetical protein V1512DRAFT_259124 [Lipomyces arxii]|uniref:uncharacterized protein n=1 Tax=Lipomyces arxii TaxID=56418 RepID=UPI0034CD5EDD